LKKIRNIQWGKIDILVSAIIKDRKIITHFVMAPSSSGKNHKYAQSKKEEHTFMRWRDFERKCI